MTDEQLIKSLRSRANPGDCQAAAFRIEELCARVAELETRPDCAGAGQARQQETKQDSPWIDPNDKTQKQFLPWVGEKVLFCHAGMTYYGHHTGGSFQSFNPPKRFNTWSCHWMYPPKAVEKIQQTEAGG